MEFFCILIIELKKRFKHLEDQPLASYMRRVAEDTESFSRKSNMLNPFYLRELAQAISIDHFLEKYGAEFALNGRYQDVWVDFATLLGLEVSISKNGIISTRYKNEYHCLERRIPDKTGHYKAKIGVGRDIYPELIGNMKRDRTEVLLHYL